MDVQESSVLKVEVSTADKSALGAVGRMFLELAGITAAALVAELKPLAPSYPGEFTTGVFELQLGEVLNEQTTVDTAAVFAQPQAPAAPPAPPVPTPPVASVAPPAPAAAPSAPPAPPAPAGVEVDKNGLPWDARINTKNKEKTQKGVWKVSKGLPEGLYDQVCAELKQTIALTPAAPAAPPAPAAPAAVTPPAPPAPAAPITAGTPGIPGMIHNYTRADIGGTYSTAPGEAVPAGCILVSTVPAPTAPPAPPAPPATAAPVTPVPPLPAPAAPAADETVPSSYNGLLQAITPHLQTQKITSEEINMVCAQYGLPTLTQAVNAPQLIPVIYEGCKAIWSGR